MCECVKVMFRTCDNFIDDYIILSYSLSRLHACGHKSFNLETLSDEISNLYQRLTIIIIPLKCKILQIKCIAVADCRNYNE